MLIAKTARKSSCILHIGLVEASVVYNHMAYWLNGLNTLDMPEQGTTTPGNAAPSVGTRADPKPDAVASDGADRTYRKAFRDRGSLRGFAIMRSVFGVCDGREHC